MLAHFGEHPSPPPPLVPTAAQGQHKAMGAGRGGAGGALGPHFSFSDLSYSTPAGSQSPGEGHSHSRVHTYLGVASHIVHINAQEVAEPVRHEHGSQVGLDHGVNAAAQEADARQLLQVDAVGQAVHVRPPDPCGSKGGYDELWSLAAWPRLPEGRFVGPTKPPGKLRRESWKWVAQVPCPGQL